MRIAIANDQLLAVDATRRVVLSTGEHTIAWVAHDGTTAVELCAGDRPDVILMDLLMPRMGGVEATRRIMAHTPCPILVVTADVDRHCAGVFAAMGVGALDAVNTPALAYSGKPDGANALLAKLETIGRLTGTRTRNTERGTWKFTASQRSPTPALPPGGRTPLVAIGASAGGPAALVRVLSHWPADFPAAVVVVQHVDAQFAPGLAHWLAGHTALRVRPARDGDHPHPGTVLIAGRNDHLVLDQPTRLVYTPKPAHAVFRPSVDVFFHSLVKYWPGEVIGVLLTGMGRDGAEGLKQLRNAGHCTLAQDRPSSAVYGMPKAAAELRAAREILPLDRIGPRVAIILGANTAKKLK